ncbi:MAG: hypothetical protein ACM3Q1_05415 [Bacteroidales bacterium]
MRIHSRIVLALLATVALTAPAAAEEQDGDWLGAVGDFVRAGLGPARTIDDIRREEERAREAREAAAAKAEAAAAAKAEPAPAVKVVSHPAPAPVVPAAPEPEAFAPVVAAPVVPAAPVAPRPQPKPAATAAAAPAPAPVPVPVARPKPVVPVAARVPTPPPPPEPLGSRIAATATVDQAIKLGGSADTYGQRIAKPVRN